METHILFFILAGLLIAIIAGYSFWSARREKSRVFSNTFSSRPPANTAPSSSSSVNNIPLSLNSDNFSAPQDQVQQQAAAFSQEVANDVQNIKITLDGTSSSYSVSDSLQNNAPQYATEQLSFQGNPDNSHTQNMQEPQQVEEAPLEESSQIITLYVVAAEGQHFVGNVIQQNLEALGFQFGEYQIFHRHLDNSASPVLFSAANMMQPGVFDINQMEQFTTVGLVFFMHIPSPGSDIANLRLMLSCVEYFAQSMGGFILDDEQQLFNDETRHKYLLKISQ